MAVIERYCISDFQDEVRTLVARGSIDRQQRIYELKQFFGDRQWQEIEHLSRCLRLCVERSDCRSRRSRILEK